MLTVVIVTLFVTVGFQTTLLTAKETNHFSSQEDIWLPPINISQSGAAAEPRMVLDQSGSIHVIWREETVNSFYYAVHDELGWQRPMTIEVPFGTARFADQYGQNLPLFDPQLVVDQNDRLHALWLDGQNRLYYSSVPLNFIADYESWSFRQQIGDGVLAFDVLLDMRNVVQMVYLRHVDSAETPAGIYYRQLNHTELFWSVPKQLEASAYFRALDEEKAHLDLEAGVVGLYAAPEVAGGEAISETQPITSSAVITHGLLLAWENAPLEQVYLIRANDDLDNWLTPALVDQRIVADDPQSTGPSQIRVAARKEEIHLIWTAGHDTDCELYHQWSNDSSLSWTTQAPLTPNQGGCPSTFEFVPGHEEVVLLKLNYGGQIFLQLWNGQAWSPLKQQPPLAGFIDRRTNREITLGCHQSIITPENTLLVVGCGTGQIDDIWFLERFLGDETAWFPTQTGQKWADPLRIFQAEVQLGDPLILTDNSGLTHLFWLGAPSAADLEAGATIFHTQWNQDSWARVVPLLHLGIDQVDQLKGVVGHRGNVVLFWRDATAHEYQFSVVNEKHIRSPVDWSTPTTLPASESTINHPSVFIDTSGTINVVYAKRFNEGRGIYLVRSVDNGRSWTDPLQVTDAAAAGWDMVDGPQIVQTGNGHMHTLWTSYTLKPDPVPSGLHYSRSEDGGLSWSSATTEAVLENKKGWCGLTAVGKETVIIFKHPVTGNISQIQAIVSRDSGLTWNSPVVIFNSPTSLTAPEIVSQSSANFSIVRLTTDSAGNVLLEERPWINDGWRTLETTNVDVLLDPAVGEITAKAGGINKDGQIFYALIDGPISLTSGPENPQPFNLSIIQQQTKLSQAEISPPSDVVNTPAAIPMPAAADVESELAASQVAEEESVNTESAELVDQPETDAGARDTAAGFTPPTVSGDSSLVINLLLGVVPVILALIFFMIGWLRLRR